MVLYQCTAQFLTAYMVVMAIRATVMAVIPIAPEYRLIPAGRIVPSSLKGQPPNLYKDQALNLYTGHREVWVVPPICLEEEAVVVRFDSTDFSV